MTFQPAEIEMLEEGEATVRLSQKDRKKQKRVTEENVGKRKGRGNAGRSGALQTYLGLKVKRGRRPQLEAGSPLREMGRKREATDTPRLS